MRIYLSSKRRSSRQLVKSSRKPRAPWKSSASAPRKATLTCSGFSPCSRPPIPLPIRRLHHSHVRIRASVIKQILVALTHHSFHEHHIRNLPNFLPFFFRSKDRRFRSRNHAARIIPVKHGNASTINQLVVSPVINQKNSLSGSQSAQAPAPPRENQISPPAPAILVSRSLPSSATDLSTRPIPSDPYYRDWSPGNTSSTCHQFSPARSPQTSSSEHSSFPYKREE